MSAFLNQGARTPTSGSAGQPDDAEAGSGAGGNGASFADVQAILDQHCVRCHDANNTHPLGYAALPLTADAAYEALVSRPALETCGGTLVVPSDPASSYLMHKIATATPCEGSRMLRPFEVGPAVPLSDDEIATVQEWIAGGAKH